MAFYFLLVIFLVQRMTEMKLGQLNLSGRENQLIFPLDQEEKNQMLFLHAGWFLSCFIEYVLVGHLASPIFFILSLGILLGCQFIRYKTMKVLGKEWTPYPIAFKNQEIRDTGPYRFIKHPNYLVVMIEIATVPLMGNCTKTALIFSIMNFLFLKRRIQKEEYALSHILNFEKLKMKKKLIPFIFTLALMNNLYAETLSLQSKNYDEAKDSATYFSLIGESTKFGLIKTTFDGYAKKGVLTFEKNEILIQNITLKLDASEIDTNNSMRDEKMHQQCLKTDTFKEILVEIDSLSLELPKQEVPGTMTIMNRKVPLKIQLNRQDENTFKGSTSFKLSEAFIPDPSIAIAKVNNLFKIEFQVKFK